LQVKITATAKTVIYTCDSKSAIHVAGEHTVRYTPWWCALYDCPCRRAVLVLQLLQSP